jgi:hypothetical protein
MHAQHSQNMPTSIHRNPYQMSDKLIFSLFPSSLLNPAQNDVLQYQGQTIPSPFLPANISSPSSRLLSLALARSAVRPPAPLPLELCPLEEVTVDRLAERICLRSCCSRCSRCLAASTSAQRGLLGILPSKPSRASILLDQLSSIRIPRSAAKRASPFFTGRHVIMERSDTHHLAFSSLLSAENVIASPSSKSTLKLFGRAMP